jgi:hypothetical protein
MKARVGVITLALLCLSGAVEAGIFGWLGFLRGRSKLPQPIDSPIVRPKVREDHKQGKKQRHPARQEDYLWGTRRDLIFRDQTRPVDSRLKEY